MIGFLIAVISGLLMSVQGVFNTQVTKTTGMWVANAFVQFTAFLICIAIWGNFRPDIVRNPFESGAAVHVNRRHLRRGHYLYGYQGNGYDGTGKSRHDDCDGTDFSGVSYRAFRTFRGGKTALFLEKGNRHSAGGRRYYFVQMGVNYPCKNEATPLQ